MRFPLFGVLLLLSGALDAQTGPHSLLQTFRDAAGLSMPEQDEVLMASSAARADELSRQGRLSHLDGQGRGAPLQLLSQGYTPGEFGEILGAGPTLGQVWAAWLASPSHRAVLEARGWTKWGWGVSPEKGVWVLRFWKP